MKAYLNKPGGKALLLTLDSENEAEAQLLNEMRRVIPVLQLTASGSTVEGIVRLQYEEINLEKTLKSDMEELYSYACNCDDCTDDDFAEMRRIAEHWKLLGR